MTQEEKAQAYDEALDRMKHVVIVPKNEEALQALKETIFPELAESEDEKIRKVLLNLVSNDKVNGYTEFYKQSGITCDDAIAYLEKPKEPIDPFDTKLFQDGVKEGRRLEREDIKKEQQPAEWSEEDEKIRRNLMSLLANMRGDRITEETYQKYYSWLKFLRPSKDCSDCAKHLEGYISGRCDAENKLLEQFGALVTPEDELHIKPRWKPSEEQMKALYCALNDAISLYSDKVSPLYEEISRTHFDALESLYNDLKKL